MKTRSGGSVNRNFSTCHRGYPENPCSDRPSRAGPFPLDNCPGLFYRKPFGEGKTVQFRRGPAAVTGDESRSCHCPKGREGRPVRRSGSQKTSPLRFAGRPSWDRAKAATPKDKNGVPGQSMSGDFFLRDTWRCSKSLFSSDTAISARNSRGYLSGKPTSPYRLKESVRQSGSGRTWNRGP